MTGNIGRFQLHVLRLVSGGGTYVADSPSKQRSCRRLHDRGYLSRDPQNSWGWKASAAGLGLLSAIEREAA